MQYIASEGKVWDFKEPKYKFDPTTLQETQIHLYAKYLYLGVKDTIDNYIEVGDPYGN